MDVAAFQVQMQKLDNLKNMGVLTQEEYNQKKMGLVDSYLTTPGDSGPSPAPAPQPLQQSILQGTLAIPQGYQPTLGGPRGQKRKFGGRGGGPIMTPPAAPVASSPIAAPSDFSLHANNKNVKVTRMDPETTREDLSTAFSQFGMVASVAHKGAYAYVNFQEATSAHAACGATGTVLVRGRPVVIKLERSKVSGPLFHEAVQQAVACLPGGGIAAGQLQLTLGWNQRYAASLGDFRAFLSGNAHLFSFDHENDFVYPAGQGHYGGGGGGGGGGGNHWAGKQPGGWGAAAQGGRASKRQKVPEPAVSKGVGLFNLPLDTTEGSLAAMFGNYAGYSHMKMVINSATGQFKGMAFASFDSEESASVAKIDLATKGNDGFWGQRVDVKFAHKDIEAPLE